MSADELRKAAETLRERAAAWHIETTPWSIDRSLRTPQGTPEEYGWFVCSEQGLELASVRNDHRDEAAYIATMHPGVGLALADWLDQCAERLDRGHHTGSRYSHQIARLINGGGS